jgi:hypothetical protein
VSRSDTGLSAQCCIVAGMVLPREWVEQRRGMIPRRVGVMAQSCGVRALNAWTCKQERGVVCVGTLERGGPRRRGTQPSSEADLARGGVQPSSEVDLARGGVQPSSEVDLARGGVQPCRSGGPREPPGS